MATGSYEQAGEDDSLFEINSESSEELDFAELVGATAPAAPGSLGTPPIDLESASKERNARDFALMASLDPQAASSLLASLDPQASALSPVVAIQALVRGWQGRREYVRRLYDQYLMEEEQTLEKQRRQTEEGLMVLDSLSLEKQRFEGAILDRAAANRRNRGAYIIQRAFSRSRRRRKVHGVAGGVGMPQQVALPPPPPTMASSRQWR